MRNLAIALSMMLVLQAQSSQRQSAEERGTVEGTITRSGTPDPVAGAQIRLTSPAVLQRLVDLLSVQGVTIALRPNGVADDAYVQRGRAIHVAQGATTSMDIAALSPDN
jgi:hypothetical protein